MVAAMFVAGLLAACSGGSESGADSPATRTVIPGIATDSASGTPALEAGLMKVASGFQRPTFVTSAGDGSGRLFILEKQGIVRIV